MWELTLIFLEEPGQLSLHVDEVVKLALDVFMI